MTVVELDPVDAELFVQFRRYQEQFTILLTRGVFSDYCGYKAIHKDGHHIRMIETHFADKISI